MVAEQSQKPHKMWRGSHTQICAVEWRQNDKLKSYSCIVISSIRIQNKNKAFQQNAYTLSESLQQTATAKLTKAVFFQETFLS